MQMYDMASNNNAGGAQDMDRNDFYDMASGGGGGGDIYDPATVDAGGDQDDIYDPATMDYNSSNDMGGDIYDANTMPDASENRRPNKKAGYLDPPSLDDQGDLYTMASSGGPSNETALDDQGDLYTMASAGGPSSELEDPDQLGLYDMASGGGPTNTAPPVVAAEGDDFYDMASPGNPNAPVVVADEGMDFYDMASAGGPSNTSTVPVVAAEGDDFYDMASPGNAAVVAAQADDFYDMASPENPSAAGGRRPKKKNDAYLDIVDSQSTKVPGQIKGRVDKKAEAAHRDSYLAATNSAPAGSSRPKKSRKDDYLDIGESTEDTNASVYPMATKDNQTLVNGFAVPNAEDTVVDGFTVPVANEDQEGTGF